MRKHDNITQGTDEWLHLRKGKLTGTVLKAIMGTPKAKQDAIYEMVYQRLRLGLDPEDYENPMDRGTRLEPEARAMFEFETGLSTYEIGFITDDDNEHIAQSPDGYILGTDDTEALEIKCPGGKNYVKFWLTNAVPDDYYWQVIQYFVVNDKLQKLYFVGYNPDIPTHPMHVIEVKRESLQNEIKQARVDQVAFLTEVDKVLSKLVKI